MMTVVDFLLLLLVAGIIGAIGEAIAGYSPGGCAMSIVLGFVGAFIGRWLHSMFKFPDFVVGAPGHAFPVISSVIGAALLILVLRLILSRRARV